jgi:nucleoside-diphosphate-sugar epimerase
MKVLVTGGTGFVGGHLIDALLRAGDSVTALIRSPKKAAGLGERGVRIVAGDLEDPAALREAARDQDVVYHGAGLVAARDEAEFLTVNRDGTAKVLAAASEVSQARFVLISSLAAAGPSPRGGRRVDDESPAPVTAYGRSKLAGEQVVRAGTLAWSIVRPPGVYGPRDPEFLRVFKAVRLGVVPVFGDGSQQLSLVYAPDLAGALAALGRSSGTAGRIFYPCHPEVVSSGELARTIGRAMGRSVRLIGLPRWVAGAALALTSTAARLTGGTTLLTRDKANEFFAPAWTADPAPLSAATGWRAEHDLAAGAEATGAWYRAAGWL